ncbi:Hpt domain-containing protein [Pseudodesulfovibrio sp.]|uniref:Hpt domain-containing protein n=1 Tax=unclassified Pseudodesulfovibrio TaxID=2661612 RepID=UPI003AFF71FE
MPVVIVDRDLKPIMPRFFELQRQGLDELARAVAEGNAETARLVGHRMKGTGTSYGFPGLTDSGAAIENAAQKGDLAEAGRLGRAVAEFLDGVTVVYEEMPL